MTHKKNNTTCIQEDRISRIEDEINTLDKKQDKLSESIIQLTTEVSQVKWLLVSMIGLAGVIAIELFRLL
jgi:uncharacterized protein YlxW (UPF0749 family)